MCIRDWSRYRASFTICSVTAAFRALSNHPARETSDIVCREVTDSAHHFRSGLDRKDFIDSKKPKPFPPSQTTAAPWRPPPLRCLLCSEARAVSVWADGRPARRLAASERWTTEARRCVDPDASFLPPEFKSNATDLETILRVWGQSRDLNQRPRNNPHTFPSHSNTYLPVSPKKP